MLVYMFWNTSTGASKSQVDLELGVYRIAG